MRDAPGPCAVWGIATGARIAGPWQPTVPHSFLRCRRCEGFRRKLQFLQPEQSGYCSQQVPGGTQARRHESHTSKGQMLGSATLSLSSVVASAGNTPAGTFLGAGLAESGRWSLPDLAKCTDHSWCQRLVSLTEPCSDAKTSRNDLSCHH